MLLQLTSNGMGSGDEVLGMQLIENYFKLILQEDSLPKVLVFYNSGVKLLAEGSTVIASLKAIEAKGVQLLACKTCLNHFKLMDKQLVGKAGTMLDIIALQNEADKVVSL